MGSGPVKSDHFFRSVGVLASGTIIAQMVSAAALPVLTRLYSPGDFGELAVFVALVSTISVAACLRYDVAIPLPERDIDAAGLLALAALCAAGISLLCALALVVARAERHLVVLVPPAVFLAALYSALQFWFVRHKRFPTIARVRVGQTLPACACQIGAGWGGWAPVGLLLGPLLSAAIGGVTLMFRLGRVDRAMILSIRVSHIVVLARKFSRFPKYSALEALSNSAGIQIPVILIALTVSGPEAGFVFLAMYALQAPMSLLGGAIAQVFLSQAPEHHRSATLGTFTVGVFGKLVLAGAGPLIFSAIVSPSIIPLIFGNEWARAGVLVTWMMPWFLLQFLSSPVSMALLVANHHGSALLLQLFGLILRAGSVSFFALLSPQLASEAYAVSGFLFYAIYLAVIFRAVDASYAEIANEILRGAALILAWALVGGLVAFAASFLT